MGQQRKIVTVDDHLKLLNKKQAKYRQKYIELDNKLVVTVKKAYFAIFEDMFGQMKSKKLNDYEDLYENLEEIIRKNFSRLSPYQPVYEISFNVYPSAAFEAYMKLNNWLYSERLDCWVHPYIIKEKGLDNVQFDQNYCYKSYGNFPSFLFWMRNNPKQKEIIM